MDLDKTLQRYAIVSAYINNQTNKELEADEGGNPPTGTRGRGSSCTA